MGNLDQSSQSLQGLRLATYTLGCKLNFAETSAIGRMLMQAGMMRCKNGEQADVVLINTCTVTDTADRKCRQAIHRAVRQHPNAFTVVTGCYAQLKAEEIGEFEGVDLVIGANDKFSVAEFLGEVEKKRKAEVHTTRTAEIRNFCPTCSADDRTRHFLKVQDGCDYYCTYCTIPFARGRSRNATIAETVDVARKAIEEGAHEIVLTGVNTGDFGKSTGETFLDLIKALDALEGEVRYRISSIEPNLLSDEIIDFVASSRHFAPHFHIPLQSGSDVVLKLMHRHYDTALFAERIHHIKTVMPEAFIGVDVMAGCRGETAEEFMAGYRFIESLPVSQLHVFTYSERAKTKALEIEPIVPMDERKRRSEQLHELSEQKTEAFYRSQLGMTKTVLWESSRKGGMMHGFTENYVRCVMPYDGSMANRFAELVLTEDNIQPEK